MPNRGEIWAGFGFESLPRQHVAVHTTSEETNAFSMGPLYSNSAGNYNIKFTQRYVVATVWIIIAEVEETRI